MNNNAHIGFIKMGMELSVNAYQSRQGLPIGCVIARNGEVIAAGHNEIFLQVNPTAHAEMVVISRACKQLGVLDLEGCVLYTTVEPCPMCLSAIYWAKISEVYYAVSGAEAAKVGFDDSFIFAELSKPAAERAIPLHHLPFVQAGQVLVDWKALDTYSAQHWSKG